jgi:hypothetical protein
VGVSGENAGDPGVSPLKKASFWRKAAAAFLRLWGLWLVGFLLLTLPPLYHSFQPSVPSGPSEALSSPASHRSDSEELERALRSADDEALLAFFRRRALTADERGQVQGQIEQLGDNSFRKRNCAADELRRMGSRAAGMLRRATHHSDAEIAGRARELLAGMLPPPNTRLLTTGLRRIAESGSPLAVSVLLAYLPDAETTEITEEIHNALSRAASRQPRPDTDLVRALTDPLPEKRLAAGMILVRFEEQRPAVRKVLDDPDGEVRHRVALALLAYQEKDALRVLIELLPVLQTPQAWSALDLLYHTAGVTGPAVALGETAQGRLRCRDAWLDWWEREKQRLTIPALPDSKRGPTLLVQMELRWQNGEVLELSARGETNWRFANLGCPVWASSLPADRVLVVEYGSDRVTERDHAGGIVRMIKVRRPVYAERLPDGKMFVAARDALYEFDAAGVQHDLARWPERVVATARPCKDGQTLVLTEGGTCLFLDRAGKETRRFETDCQLVLAPGIDVTANNRVLVPDHASNRVVEFAPTGEILWQAEVASPTSVQRMPDGNTLVASTSNREVVELDRSGRIVWRLGGQRQSTERGGPWDRPVVAVRKR